MAVLPDVPTVAENWISGYEASAWQGLMAPSGVPAPEVARLNQEVLKVLALPEVRNQLSRQGTDPLGSTPETYNVSCKRRSNAGPRSPEPGASAWTDRLGRGNQLRSSPVDAFDNVKMHTPVFARASAWFFH